jgi:hypothetical protein
MKQVVGIELEKFPLNLRHIVDLIYFEGPLLSVFENEFGDYYLYCWCEVDNLYNRWLVFRIHRNQLIQYLERKINLLELILHPVDGLHYLLDLDSDLQVNKFYIVLPDALPDLYLPEADAYYDEMLLDAEFFERDKQTIEQIICSQDEQKNKEILAN